MPGCALQNGVMPGHRSPALPARRTNCCLEEGPSSEATTRLRSASSNRWRSGIRKVRLRRIGWGTRLEQRDYAGAAKEFEATISREPRMFDAYIQAAAAYQLLGEKAKAAEMLARHADERRKAEQR